VTRHTPQVELPDRLRGLRVAAVACCLPRFVWSDATWIARLAAERPTAEEFFGAHPELEYLSLRVDGLGGDAPIVRRFARVDGRPASRRLSADEDHPWADKMVGPPPFVGRRAC
jgi:hypothetical protein